MEVVRLTEYNRDETIEKAVGLMVAGGVVAFPTETFYGLGVHYDNLDALRRLYEIKGRPPDKAIPVIIGSQEMLPLISDDVPDVARKLMAMYWPGPLTIILPARKDLQKYLTANSGRVAVRVPGRSFALYLARSALFPVTATSANPSGFPPAEDADDVIRYFGNRIDLVIDGGKTPGGKPSTIVEITENRVVIVREGAIAVSVS